MKEIDELVHQYLSHLSIERGLSKNTTAAYRRDLAKFSAFLESNELSLEGLGHSDLDLFAASLRTDAPGAARLSESSISRAIVTVRNLVAFSAKEKNFHNQIAQYKPPRIHKRLPKAMSVESVLSLIANAEREGEVISLRDVAIVELMYATGARVSEIIDLKLADVVKAMDGGEGGIISIRLTGKGGKERIVPIGQFAQKALDQYLVRVRPSLVAARREGALFLNQRGTRLSRQSAWQIIHDAAVRAGIGDAISPHALRHSFATHLLDGGADIRVVQELLGHASVTTTQIYTLVTIDRLRESHASAHPRGKR